MRRFLLVCAGVVFFLAASTGAAAASPAAGCVTAAEASFHHTFDGALGTATVTAVRPLCAGQRQSFSLVSYTSSASTNAQFRYATDHATIDARHDTVRLTVKVPGCYTQVDLIFGTRVRNEVVDAGYGTQVLGSPGGAGSRSRGPVGTYAASGTDCTPRPIVTYVNACDGAFRAVLANDADANVDALFIVSGRTIRVAPGRSTDVAARRRGTLSIRDNTFTTHISTWARPSSGCTESVPSTATATTPRRNVSDSTAAAPSGTAPTRSTQNRPDGTLVGEPVSTYLPAADAAPITRSAAGPVTSGPGPGSFLVITVGLFLMAGGAMVLMRVIRTMRHG